MCLTLCCWILKCHMDGFEVAKNVRSSSQLKDVPIIMITSRTGDKHREHVSLGVNMYMGKPFQEDILLKNIHTILNGESVDSQNSWWMYGG